MKVFISIDDTDNLESRGTGHLTAVLLKEIEEKGWGRCEPITRHQMLIHPDIPYTSHNSAMCFPAQIEDAAITRLTAFAQDFLIRESAPGSDPGLCIVAMDRLVSWEDLMDFGYRAKKEILTKAEAYALAERLSIHLSEHGGTGEGIIGALAGAGLRMTGNDGRFRGKFNIRAGNGRIQVRDLKQQTGTHAVKSLGGEMIGDEEYLRIGECL